LQIPKLRQGSLPGLFGAAPATMPRREWDSYWSWLEAGRIAGPRERANVDRVLRARQPPARRPVIRVGAGVAGRPEALGGEGDLGR
jgi:hypothetical protein